MMDSMFSPQIVFVHLYALLVCTISLVVSSVVATKKKTKNAIKKAKDSKHYSANPNDYFSSDMNALSLTVEGEPVSLKRVAAGRWGGRYDSQKWTKKSFNKVVVEELPFIHDTPLCKLGTAEVKVDATFTFTKGVIRNDIDNLVKFLLDCLETTEVFDNDVQVMDLVVRKRRGHRNMTAIKITRKAAMSDDEVIVID